MYHHNYNTWTSRETPCPPCPPCPPPLPPQIIEKRVPVDRIVEKPVPYPVERIVEKIVEVPKPYPVEKIVEVIKEVPKPYPVEKIVEVEKPVLVPTRPICGPCGQKTWQYLGPLPQQQVY